MTGAVITGLGTVGAFGQGHDALRRVLAAGEPHSREIAAVPGIRTAGGATRAALLPEPGFGPWLPAAAARRLSLPSRLALVASRMALADAGLLTVDAPTDRPATSGPDLGLAVGTAFGTAQLTERLIREIFANPQSASPFLFSESVANAPAAQAAIALFAQGPNITVCQREASGLLAVAQATTQLRRERARVMVAGEADEASPLIHSLLDRFRALARPDRTGDERPRPFDRRRNGFLQAEGATMVVLEEEAAARARSARVLARLRAAGAAFDATASDRSWGRGAEILAGELATILAGAGVPLDAIDLVVCGASGAVAGDRLEAAVLRNLWGDRPLPPVVAPKGTLGEYGGGQLAAALLALEGTIASGPPDFELDPQLGVTLAPSPVATRPRTVLVSSLAAGGAAAWLVLEAVS